MNRSVEARRVQRILLVVAMVGGSLLEGGALRAAPPDDVVKAKAAFEQAETLYRQGEFRKALAGYKQALAHKRFPAFIFNIAQCHRQLGALKQALFFYRLFLSEMPGAPNKPEVERRIQEMEQRLAAAHQAAQKIGRISVSTRPRGAVVLLDRMDGAPVARTPAILDRIPEGEHLVVIRLAGHHEVTRKVVVKQGQLAMVEIDLRPLVEPRREDPRAGGPGVVPRRSGPGGVADGDDGGGARPFHKRWWFWTGVAATVGLLAASGVTGGMAKAKADRWNDPSERISDLDAYRKSIRTLAVTTDALWITGAAVAIGTLVVALVVGKGKREQPRALVTPACGPGGCSLVVQGRF